MSWPSWLAGIFVLSFIFDFQLWILIAGSDITSNFAAIFDAVTIASGILMVLLLFIEEKAPPNERKNPV